MGSARGRRPAPLLVLAGLVTGLVFVAPFAWLIDQNRQLGTDLVEVATRRIVTGLEAEDGLAVHSEKMVEIHFRDGRPVAAGDQFGLGRVR